MIFAALNVEAFSDKDAFYGALDARIDEMKNARCAEGVEKIYMPGEPENDRMRASEEEITIIREIMDEVNALAGN